MLLGFFVFLICGRLKKWKYFGKQIREFHEYKRFKISFSILKTRGLWQPKTSSQTGYTRKKSRSFMSLSLIKCVFCNMRKTTQQKSQVYMHVASKYSSAHARMLQANRSSAKPAL